MRLELNRFCPVLFTIFAISLIFTAGFITGCGDEGDPVTDVVNGDDHDRSDHDHEPTDPDPEDPVVGEPEEPEDPKVSFKDDIVTILAERCATPNCHVAGGAGGLDLRTYDTFKKGGKSGAAFVAGDGEGSLVVKRINGGGMPPGGPPLNADQIQLFIDWINEGAENN